MKTTLPVRTLLCTLVILSAGAVGQTPAALPDAPAPSATAAAQVAPPVVPTGPTVLFDTSMGRLTCKLFSKEAPNTVANFVGLATGTKPFTDPTNAEKVTGKPFYDGTTFHRVIPGFMIQGGDRRGDGTGDGGYYFDDEVSPSLRFDVPGRLAMANSGPNTNGTQFFITEAEQPELNGKYNLFGQCDAHSVLLVATIARVERNGDDKPLTPVVLKKVTVVPDGQPIPPDPSATAPAASTPPSSPNSVPSH